MYKVCYWDAEAKAQKERDATPAEVAEIDARRNAPPNPEDTRKAAIDSAIDADSTIAQLKAMSNAEFSAWFAANVTTLAQARNVLERLARIVIRRVL